MRKLIAGILFSVTFALYLFTNASDSSENEIRAFFTNLTYSLNHQDVQSIGNAWSEAGEAITLAGGIYKGPQEISNLFAEAFAGPYKNAKYENHIHNIRLYGQLHAVVDGVWTTDNGPKNYPDCGLFLYILTKRNGTWKIDMASASVPNQGHTAEHGRNMSWIQICNSANGD